MKFFYQRFAPMAQYCLNYDFSLLVVFKGVQEGYAVFRIQGFS
jgi:hypothetical protein